MPRSSSPNLRSWPTSTPPSAAWRSFSTSWRPSRRPGACSTWPRSRPRCWEPWASPWRHLTGGSSSATWTSRLGPASRCSSWAPAAAARPRSCASSPASGTPAAAPFAGAPPPRAARSSSCRSGHTWCWAPCGSRCSTPRGPRIMRSRARARRRARTSCRQPWRLCSWRTCCGVRAAWRPWRTGPPCCRWGSSRGWPSRACCSPSPRWCSWTSAPRPWTWSPRRASTPGSGRAARRT
mmetsp:Transcript_88536/g.258801  ORF Transcript_88536/g.258801 Transcript_88536/m.258801 type:complete len:237 (+) Transcript_88536:1121-1831(+)